MSDPKKLAKTITQCNCHPHRNWTVLLAIYGWSSEGDKVYWKVNCERCDRETDFYDTPEEAIAEWEDE